MCYITELGSWKNVIHPNIQYTIYILRKYVENESKSMFYIIYSTANQIRTQSQHAEDVMPLENNIRKYVGAEN